MTYLITKAETKEAVVISKMLYASLKNGVDGNFSVNKEKLLNHVIETIASNDGFSIVLKNISPIWEDKTVGCFMGSLIPHHYVDGYIAQELGVFIDPEHRGSDHFQKMLEQFVCWSNNKPDVLMTTFSIGQLNATTPWLRSQLKKQGFTKADEGHYLLRKS